MDSEKPSYYSITPAKVRYDSRLGFPQIVLYGEITALANKYGYCSASNNYFANLYAPRTSSTISKDIKLLKECGHIRTVMVKDGRQIKYRKIYPLVDAYGYSKDDNSNQPIVDNERPIVENVNRGIDENVNRGIVEMVKGNNTSNNNTSNNRTTHKSNKSKKRTYDVQSPFYRLANYLYEKIKDNNPTLKEPNLQDWANSIRLMHERDSRSYDDIRNMIDWSQGNSFWSGTILSANNLRKKYDTMNAQINRDKRNNNNNKGGYDYDELPF